MPRSASTIWFLAGAHATLAGAATGGLGAGCPCTALPAGHAGTGCSSGGACCCSVQALPGRHPTAAAQACPRRLVHGAALMVLACRFGLQACVAHHQDRKQVHVAAGQPGLLSQVPSRRPCLRQAHQGLHMSALPRRFTRPVLQARRCEPEAVTGPHINSGTRRSQWPDASSRAPAVQV